MSYSKWFPVLCPCRRLGGVLSSLVGVTLTLLASGVPSASAALSYSWSGSAPIMDNDPTGRAFTFDLNGAALPTANVTVSLDIAGGWNGDLYAYLSHGTGFSVLLNRLGMSGANSIGYGEQGVNITLSGTSDADLHGYQTLSPSYNPGGQLTGTWGADGRTVSPLGPGSLFDTASRDATLTSFDGLDPNGTWTLFLADLSPGNVEFLRSFSVQVTPTAIPEPSTATAGLSTLLAVVWVLCRRRSVGPGIQEK